MNNPINNGRIKPNVCLFFTLFTLFFAVNQCVAQYPVKLLKNVDSRYGSIKSSLHEYNNHLFFGSSQGIFNDITFISAYALFITDGDKVIRLKNNFRLLPDQFVNFAGKVFFITSATEDATEIWTTDGTATGTKLFKSFRFVSDLYIIGNQLFFSAADENSLDELWVTDGTISGTRLVKDINSGSAGSYPRFFSQLNGKLVFTADNGIHGNKLWTSDGTTAGTFLLTTAVTFPQEKFLLDNKLYFIGSLATNSRELWMTDGTSAGTQVVKKIAPNNLSDNVSNLILFNDQLFFSANDRQVGQELWVSDGTSNGTNLFRDFTIGSDGTFFRDFEVANDQLFFNIKSESNTPYQLWTTDSTTNGTIFLQEVEPTSGSFNTTAKNFTAFANRIFFQSSANATGSELWVTDGTPNGTFLYNNLYTETRFSSTTDPSSNPEKFYVFNDRLYFVADSDLYGIEYFSIDYNNTCKQAVEITATTKPSFQTFSNILTTASGVDKPTCFPFTPTYNDVWFKTNVPPSGSITIETGQVENGLTNTSLQVFAGSCNNLKQVACDDNDGEGQHAKVELTNRSAGERLYIRVADFGNNDFGNFSISVSGDCVCAQNGQVDNTPPRVIGYNNNRSWIDYEEISVSGDNSFIRLSNDTLYYARFSDNNNILSFTCEDVIITDNCPTNPINIVVEANIGGISDFCSEDFVVWTLTDACGNTSKDTLHVRIGCASNPLKGLTFRNVETRVIDYEILNDNQTTPIKLSCEQVDAFFDPTQYSFNVDIGFSCNGGESKKFRRARRFRGRNNRRGLCYMETWTAESGSLACVDPIRGAMTKTIEVYDDKAPVFTLPNDIQLTCNQDFTNLDITGRPTNVSDNCGVQSIDFNDTFSSTNDCSQTVVVTRSWMVKDSCNNTTTQDQIITLIPDGSNSPIQFLGITINGEFKPSTTPTSLRLIGDGNEFSNCELNNFTIVSTTSCSGNVTDNLVFSNPQIDGNCCDSYYSFNLTDDCGNELSIVIYIETDESFNFSGFKYLPEGDAPETACANEPFFTQDGVMVKSGDIIIVDCQEDLSEYETLIACFGSSCNATFNPKFRRARRFFTTDLCQQEIWEWDDNTNLIFEFENCPEYLFLDESPITSGSYFAKNQIFSTAVLEDDAEVRFVAGNSIVLLAGFSSINANTFEASVEPFNNCSSTVIRSTQEDSELPSTKDLQLTYFPNPITTDLNLEFSLPLTARDVTIDLLNFNGQTIENLYQSAVVTHTQHHLHKVLDNKRSGIYFIRLQTSEQIVTKKIIVLR